MAYFISSTAQQSDAITGETNMDLMDKYHPLTDTQAQAMAEFDRLMDVAEAHADADQMAQYDALRARAYAVINVVGMTEPR